MVFQNKNVMCQYRAVGHPIATAVTEGLVELAAAKIGMDPVEMRRRNLIRRRCLSVRLGRPGSSSRSSRTTPALDKIVAMMDYEALRARAGGACASAASIAASALPRFIEVTNPSAAFYGVGGARISAQDGATVKLDATGAVICHTGVTEQGQGAEAVMAQVVASAFGVPIERVRVVTGDTDNTPYGGGTWASRAAGIGGEAGWQAGKALRAQRAGGRRLASCRPSPRRSTSATAWWSTPTPARERIGLDEVARIAYFRPDTLPPGFQAELMATRHYVPRAWPFAFTNGIQAC